MILAFQLKVKGVIMVNGLYTASEGMKNMLNKTEVVSHNLANANTTGFKKSILLAETEITVKRNDEWKLHQDENSKIEGNHINWEHGPLIQSGDPFDFAIEGEGFFKVETPDGERYTRNGTFTRNTLGELVTLNGNPVLDEGGGHIRIEGSAIQVANDGSIYVDNKAVAKLGIAEFKDKSGLQRASGSLFIANDPSTPENAKQARIKQGYLEGANVSAVDAMVELIRYNRNYEADSKALQSCDSTLEKAVNEIGRVNG